MERQEFEDLRLEEQIAYVNKRSNMKVKEIAEEIGMPPSSLSNLLSNAGYRRIQGIYVKQPQFEAPNEESHSIKFHDKDLQELLQHKEQLLNLLREQQYQAPNKLDFTVLDCYGGNKKAVSIELPEDQIEEMNAFIKKTGLKKQLLFSLAIYQFMKSYG